MKFTVVTPETLYESIDTFVTENKTKITTYDEMIETILKMMKEGFCFPFDRDILRDAMESLTYTYCPGDDMNRDRVVCQLEDVPDDESDEDDDDDVDPMNALASLGGPGGPGGDPMKLMSQLFSGMVDPPKKKEEEVNDEVKEVKEEDVEVEITDDKNPVEKKEE